MQDLMESNDLATFQKGTASLVSLMSNQVRELRGVQGSQPRAWWRRRRWWRRRW